MAAMRRLAGLALLAVSLPWPLSAAMTTAAAQTAPLRCTLQVTHGAAGQPVQLRLTLTNAGRAGVHVLVWGTPFEGWFAPFVTVAHDGAVLPYQGPSVKRGDPERSEYLRIAAGRSRSAAVDLAQAFDLRRPGHYRVEPRLVLHDVLAVGDAAPPRGRAQHAAQPLECNAVAFELRPPLK